MHRHVSRPGLASPLPTCQPRTRQLPDDAEEHEGDDVVDWAEVLSAVGAHRCLNAMLG